MEDELLAKMHRRIEVGISCEEDLLFFLVNIRKLLERKDLKRDYPVLLFYCDWSVHAAMDRQGAEQMLQSVDELIDRHLNGNQDTLREVAAFSLACIFRHTVDRCWISPGLNAAAYGAHRLGAGPVARSLTDTATE